MPNGMPEKVIVHIFPPEEKNNKSDKKCGTKKKSVRNTDVRRGEAERNKKLHCVFFAQNQEFKCLV